MTNEEDNKRIIQLEAILHSILDDIDFTSGACQPTEMIGAVLNPINLKNAQEILGRNQ